MTSSHALGTSTTGAEAASAGLRFEQRDATVIITLDRAAKLNAIDSGMKAALASAIPTIARDPQVYGVILSAAPCRMFSAGGDIREYYELASRDPTLAAAECAREYSLVWLLDCFSKPTLALIDGAIVGTAAGYAQAVTHRIAGAGYRFQMPETAIGFFPDNGVCWLLARLPRNIGIYLGLTGAAVDRADAYRLGLITHCIDARHFDSIVDGVAAADPIDPIVDGLHEEPGPAPIDRVADVIERSFAARTVGEILRRLEEETSNRDWCDATAATLMARSPLALEVTLEHLRRARHLDLRQTLMVDYRLAVRLVGGNDFFEGVRTRLIAKEGTPRWRPPTLDDVEPAMVARYFDPMPGMEMQLPTRSEMLGARV